MSINEYHKIDSVFLRDPATNHKTFLDGQWSRPEFGYLADLDWTWTEKVDGTNIRVTYDLSEPAALRKARFNGRTDAAQLPGPLANVLPGLFPTDKLADIFPDDKNDNLITLYGEGYGVGIQKGGGLYRPDQSFILFDVRVGNVWLRRDAVEDIALHLGIGIVPVVGKGPLAVAIDMARDGFDSFLEGSVCIAEGLVMRPAIELNDRMGRRIITKVKTKDFANG